MVATSIVFINEIAKICEETGADAKEVKEVLNQKSELKVSISIAWRAFSGGGFSS